jgi:hypothetical protein
MFVPLLHKLGMRPAALLLAANMMQAGPCTAAAEEDTSPFAGNISLELQSDWTFHSQDPDEKLLDTFATIEAEFSLTLAPGLNVITLLDFEPVSDPEPGEDRLFGDMGLYAEALYGEFDSEVFALRIGKFGQKFGIAWDVAPGIWGADFADYELDEQMGIAGELRVNAKRGGKHSLTLGSFFTDTTILSDSAITRRGRTRKSDGGPGNTEDFSSFSIALEGGHIASFRRFGYHVAFVRRDANGPDERDEIGYAAAATFGFEFGEIEILPLVEWARLQNQDGAPGVDTNFLTIAAELKHGPWSLALVWTGRRTSASGQADQHDRFAESSLGYGFENGIKISTGWRHTNEADITADTLGVLIEYQFDI